MSVKKKNSIHPKVFVETLYIYSMYLGEVWFPVNFQLALSVSIFLDAVRRGTFLHFLNLIFIFLLPVSVRKT